MRFPTPYPLDRKRGLQSSRFLLEGGPWGSSGFLGAKEFNCRWVNPPEVRVRGCTFLLCLGAFLDESGQGSRPGRELILLGKQQRATLPAHEYRSCWNPQAINWAGTNTAWSQSTGRRTAVPSATPRGLLWVDVAGLASWRWVRTSRVTGHGPLCPGSSSPCTLCALAIPGNSSALGVQNFLASSSVLSEVQGRCTTGQGTLSLRTGRHSIAEASSQRPQVCLIGG